MGDTRKAVVVICISSKPFNCSLVIKNKFVI